MWTLYCYSMHNELYLGRDLSVINYIYINIHVRVYVYNAFSVIYRIYVWNTVYDLYLCLYYNNASNDFTKMCLTYGKPRELFNVLVLPSCANSTHANVNLHVSNIVSCLYC